MFLGIVAVSATDLIVDKGKPTELAVYQRQGWRSENNLLCGGGEGNNLRALYSYQPDGLTVDLDFSIAELNATAAGIGLGDMLFGFDGGKAANLFTRPYQTRGTLSGSDPLQAGKSGIFPQWQTGRFDSLRYPACFCLSASVAEPGCGSFVCRQWSTGRCGGYACRDGWKNLRLSQ